MCPDISVTDAPFVSVCLPTWNGDKYLESAISSVLGQTYRDFELVIVDDGSTDQTLEIARSFSSSEPRVWIHANEKRLGIPTNFNRALALARGAFINVFNQDDMMLPTNLERKVKTLCGNPALAFVHSAIELIVEPSAPRPLMRLEQASEDDVAIEGGASLRKLILHGDFICESSVLFRRSAIEELGGFNESLHFAFDYEAWMRMSVRHHVAYLAAPLVRYRWHATNITHQYWFEPGLAEGRTAVANALRDLAAHGGRRQDVEILSEAATAVDLLRQRISDLEKDLEKRPACP